jgi:hypothetical protein
MNDNAIGKEVVDAAVQVDRELSPGLLGTVYEVVLAVLASLRETQTQAERGGAANAASPPR